MTLPMLTLCRLKLPSSEWLRDPKAWSFAALKPQMTERLIILNLPHPRGLVRELAIFGRSSFDAMMNYYRANYPRDPYTSGAFVELPEVQAPVLQFHGLADTALLPDALNNTSDLLASDWTLVTIPGVSHWPHHAVPDKVSNMMKAWLELH